MPPTAHAGTTPAPTPFAALPATLALSGLASTPGVGATAITEWDWQLKARPTGSTAALTNANTATPTLTFDLPGTYLVWCRCKNDLNQWSQASTSFPETAATMPTALLKVVAATQHLGLAIKAKGERDYHAKDEAVGLQLDYLAGLVNVLNAGAPIDTLYVDTIREKTLDHGVDLEGVWFEDQIVKALIINPLAEASLASISFVNAADHYIDINGFALRLWGDCVLQTNRVAERSANHGVEVDGLLIHDDTISPNLANTYVKIQKNGTATADLEVGQIKAPPGNYVNIVDPLASKLGGSTPIGGVTAMARHAAVIKASWSRTTPGSTAETTMVTIPIAANVLSVQGSQLHCKFYFDTAANSNTKKIRVKYAGQLVKLRDTVASGGLIIFDFVLARHNTDTQNAYGFVWDFMGASEPITTAPLTATEANTNDLIVTIECPTDGSDCRYLGGAVVAVIE